MTTNVNIPEVWKLPLRDQLLRGYNGNAMAQSFDSLEKYLEDTRPMHFYTVANILNKTNTAYASWGGATTLLTAAPHDCSLYISCAGHWASTATNQVDIYVADRATGTSMLTGIARADGVNNIVAFAAATSYQAAAFNGVYHYNKGQPVGYEFFGKVTTSDCYMYLTIHSEIVFRRRSAVEPY